MHHQGIHEESSRFSEISKVNIIPVPSTHVFQGLSMQPREAVSHVLVKGETISHHANFPEQVTRRSRSRRWLQISTQLCNSCKQKSRVLS